MNKERSRKRERETEGRGLRKILIHKSAEYKKGDRNYSLKERVVGLIYDSP